MPYCPQCRSEYRQGFDECRPCQVPLVPELAPEVPIGAEGVEAAVASGEAVVVARGGYDSARRMRDALAARRVPAVVRGDPESRDHAGNSTVYEVMIHPDALDSARSALAEQFQGMLVSEGLDLDRAGAVVDFESAAQIECPACGTQFTPSSAADAECPDCGLFLGVPEE